MNNDKIILEVQKFIFGEHYINILKATEIIKHRKPVAKC